MEKSKRVQNNKELQFTWLCEGNSAPGENLLSHNLLSLKGRKGNISDMEGMENDCVSNMRRWIQSTNDYDGKIDVRKARDELLEMLKTQGFNDRVLCFL